MSTIAVDETTHQMLAQLKDEWGLRSYDDVLRRLVRQVKSVPESLFGSAPKMRPLSRAERSRALRSRI